MAHPCFMWHPSLPTWQHTAWKKSGRESSNFAHAASSRDSFARAMVEKCSGHWVLLACERTLPRGNPHSAWSFGFDNACYNNYVKFRMCGMGNDWGWHGLELISLRLTKLIHADPMYCCSFSPVLTSGRKVIRKVPHSGWARYINLPALQSSISRILRQFFLR